MESFDLGKKFDVIVCLFGALGHLTGANALQAAVDSMAAHLTPGGVLMLEPMPTQHSEESVTRYVDTSSIKACTMSRRTPLGNDLFEIELHYLASGTEVEGLVRHAVQRSSVRACPAEVLLAAVAVAGLSGWYEEPRKPFGRGLVVAVEGPR
jgi:hypothetical protein